MTTAQLQAYISARFDQSASTISPTSSEWNRRLQLLDLSANRWRQFKFGKWKSLQQSTTLTTVVDQAYVNLPADYGSLITQNNGSIDINDYSYTIVSGTPTATTLPESAYYAWITKSSNTQYRLNISPTPSQEWDIPITYYSKYLAYDSDGSTAKLKLEDADDITRVSDPYFLIDDVCGELFIIDDEIDKGKYYKQEAENRLKVAVINEVTGEHGESNLILNDSDSNGYEPFGGIE